MAAQFTELFGAQLQSKTGPISTVDALAGKKAVLIYFSAHWCPPCRGFTPKLAEFYTKHAKLQDFEIVFVSSDRDQKAFDDYFGEMPWLALPFENRAQKEALSKKYKVQGIPTLVVLGPSGELITTEGRGKVMENFNDCAGFPWAPKPFRELLGDSFLKRNFSKKSRKWGCLPRLSASGSKQKRVMTGQEAIDGKTLGLYFSAHWCPPCRGFTPVLKAFYESYKEKDPNFEMIFVSSDGTEQEMLDYFDTDHGDYLALPFSARAAKEELSSMFKVDGIPSLVIVGADGKVINANARSKVVAGVEAVLAQGWAPPAVGDMASGPEAAGTDINECPALIVMCEGADPATQEAIERAMEPLAKKYIEKAEQTGEDPEYIFLISKGSKGPVEQLKALTKKEAGDTITGAGARKQPVMMLLDIPDRGGFYLSGADDHPVTTEAMSAFIAHKEAGRAKRMQLQRS